MPVLDAFVAATALRTVVESAERNMVVLGKSSSHSLSLLSKSRLSSNSVYEIITSSTTCSAIARLDVSPGLSIPNRLTISPPSLPSA